MVVKLKPQWDCANDKPGRDSNGYKRGFKGFADKDDGEWLKTYDPKADSFMYGKHHGDKRPDGGTSPGDLTDRFKGAKGIDSDDDGRFDDGVRG